MDSESSIITTNVDNEAAEDDVEKMKKNEIEYCKTALKLYQATSLSLAAVSQKIKSAYVLPDHLPRSEILQAKIQDLHNDVTLLKCLNDVCSLIHGNYIFSDIMHTNNLFKSQIGKANDEIAYFSKSIINLYSNQCNELDQIQKGKTYIGVLEYYQDHLKKLKSSSTNPVCNEDDVAKFEKCKRLLEKINLMRSLKSLLISKFANDPSRLPELHKLRFASRRTLTLEDFEKTWDVCYN